MRKTALIVLVVALLVPATLLAQGTKAAPAAAKVEYTPLGTYPIVKSPITVDIMVAQPRASKTTTPTASPSTWRR